LWHQSERENRSKRHASEEECDGSGYVVLAIVCGNCGIFEHRVKDAVFLAFGYSGQHLRREKMILEA
jgi:hypothetical protein